MKVEDLFKWNSDPPSPGHHVSEHTALGPCNKAGPNKLERGLPPSSVPEGLGPAPCTRPEARVNRGHWQPTARRTAPRGSCRKCGHVE